MHKPATTWSDFEFPLQRGNVDLGAKLSNEVGPPHTLLDVINLFEDTSGECKLAPERVWRALQAAKEEGKRG